VDIRNVTLCKIPFAFIVYTWELSYIEWFWSGICPSKVRTSAIVSKFGNRGVSPCCVLKLRNLSSYSAQCPLLKSVPITNLAPWGKVVLEKLTVTQLVKKFPDFMKPKVPVLCSQDSTTGPYPEPDAFIPCLCSLFPWDPF